MGAAGIYSLRAHAERWGESDDRGATERGRQAPCVVANHGHCGVRKHRAWLPIMTATAGQSAHCVFVGVCLAAGVSRA